MEHVNSLIGTSEGDRPAELNTEKKGGGFIGFVVKQLLLSNYSLSVYLNNWREELYTPVAARIICFELFSVLLMLQCIFYPKLKNQQDVIYFCSIATFMFYLSFFYIRNYIVLLIKKYKIKMEYQLNSNELPSRTTAVFLLANSILILLAFTAKEFYEYHTRFFWWN